MKSLNINIPTTIRFIRKIAKFWVFIVIILISLLYTYFWLNSMEENKLSFNLESFYADFDNVNIEVILNSEERKQQNYKLPSGNIIRIRANGVISDSTQIDSNVFQIVSSQWDEIKLSGSYKKLANVKKKQIDQSINKASVEIDISTNRDVKYLMDQSMVYRPDSYMVLDSIRINGGGRYIVYYQKYVDSYTYITEYPKKVDSKVSSEFVYSWDKPENDITNRFWVNQYFKSNFFESIRCKSLTRIYLSINTRTHRYRFKGNYELIINTYNNPLSLISIYPQPDELTASNIVYNDPDKLEILSNQGILIYGENIRKKDLIEKMNFIIASFIGVLFSILAEIGVKRYCDGRKG